MRNERLARGLSAVVGGATVLMVFAAVFSVSCDSPQDNTGAALFQEKGCPQCHAVDSAEVDGAPGLKDLFERETLPVSGRGVTEANVKAQLTDPFEEMPSYADRLTPEEMDKMVAYLKTL